jgi:hypothetical protein
VFDQVECFRPERAAAPAFLLADRIESFACCMVRAILELCLRIDLEFQPAPLATWTIRDWEQNLWQVEWTPMTNLRHAFAVLSFILASAASVTPVAAQGLAMPRVRAASLPMTHKLSRRSKPVNAFLSTMLLFQTGCTSRTTRSMAARQYAPCCRNYPQKKLRSIGTCSQRNKQALPLHEVIVLSGRSRK